MGERYNPDLEPEQPLRRWYTRVDGGRRGVSVQCWRNESVYDRKPYAVFKIDVSWRKNHKDGWREKMTWNTVELETLYHILRMDAIPFGMRVLQGLEDGNESYGEEEPEAQGGEKEAGE